MKRISLVITMLLTGGCLLPAQLPNPLHLPDPLGITDSNSSQSRPPSQDTGRRQVRRRHKRRNPQPRHRRPQEKRHLRGNGHH